MKSNHPFFLSNTTILYCFKSSFFTHSTSKRRQLLAKKSRVGDEEQERRAKLNANNRLYWNEGQHADVNYLLVVLRFDDFNSNIFHKNIRHKLRTCQCKEYTWPTGIKENVIMGSLFGIDKYLYWIELAVDGENKKQRLLNNLKISAMREHNL
jgi:hypothetical protein